MPGDSLHPFSEPTPPWWRLERHRLWRPVGDILPSVLLVVVGLIPWPGVTIAPERPLDVALVIAPAALLPWRRRAPLAVLAVCVAIAGVALLLGMAALVPILAVMVAMFAVADRTSRRPTLVALAITGALLAGVSLIVLNGDLFEPRTLQTVSWVAIAAAAGDATRSRRAYLQAVTDRAIRAEQTRESEARRRVSEERLRIARDLHDTVAHQISVISLNAGVASASLETRPESTRAALATIRSASRTVLGEIGDLLAMLRADDTSEPVPTAPHPSLRQLGALLGTFRASGLDIVLRLDGELPALPMATDAVAYRVLQEGLTNVLKHGAEKRATVRLHVQPDTLRIVISNPGHELETTEPSGYGLLGLRERAVAVHGIIEAGRTAAGFRLTVTLPLTREEASP